jgi:hypothetical protein
VRKLIAYRVPSPHRPLGYAICVQDRLPLPASREIRSELAVEQASGNGTAALEDQFGFSPQKNSPTASIQLVAGKPMGAPQASRKTRINS